MFVAGLSPKTMEPYLDPKYFPIHQIRVLTPEEEKVGMEFYQTHWEEFIVHIWEVRHTLDDLWQSGTSQRLNQEDVERICSWVKVEKQRSEQKFPFPKGYCFHITNIFEKFLKMKVQGNEPWVQPFKDYLYKGGFFRKVWGVDKEKYFQTALQIGPVILDISYNTVEILQAKVDWQLLGPKCVFREVRDLEDYLSIKSTYQGIDSYHNTVFLEIAEEYPIIYYDRTEDKFFLPLEQIFRVLHKKFLQQNLNKEPILYLGNQLLQRLEKVKVLTIKERYRKEILPGIIQKILISA